MASSAKTPVWKLLPTLIVAVVVLAASMYFFWEWQKNRPLTPVRELSVAVENGAATQLIGPYTVCELDEQCVGGQPPSMTLDESAVVKFTVPREIASSSWKLLSIYDDPEANGEQLFQSGEASEAVVDARVNGARLVVAEVSFLAVDTKNDGEEVPVVATWSVSFD
ncbi:DUF2771 family protein [Corynebacterium mayonis]|uniref:DUF2771 family protein n=1 Tax=Corynebacterium mayonis TaxID=3062461 RepID=UPI00313FF12C